MTTNTTATKKKGPKKTIAGMALYPYINRLSAKYETEGKTLEDQEYTTRLLVTKDDYKVLKKNFPKMTMSAPKVYDAQEFKKAFKIDAPKKYETNDGEYLVIGFTAYSCYQAKDGKPAEAKKAPLLMGVQKGRLVDKEGNEFDQDVSLASGTEGVIQFSPRAARDKVKLDLYKFQVRKLVEYIPQDEDEFEMDEAEEEMDAEFDMDSDDSSSDDVPFESDTDASDDEWDKE